MWFKNLRIFRLTQAWTLSPEQLHAALEPHRFQPCGSLDPLKVGWTFPLGRHGSSYVHAANGCLMLCAKRQEKVLPSAVVNEALEEKVLEISQDEARHVGRSERQTLKDEVIFSLLPRALAKSSLTYAYIDTRSSYLVVNTSSAARAEELLAALREALGSLKLLPLSSVNPPTDVMSQWLRAGAAEQGFVVGEECELKAGKDSRVVRCRHVDLTSDEVRAHLASGMHVCKLALTWNEAISCMIDEQLAIKRVKYEAAILDKVEDTQTESAADEFDRDFAIMSLELAAFINALIAAFGGFDRALENETP